MDYNLTAGTVEEVKVTDIHTAESVQVLKIDLFGNWRMVAGRINFMSGKETTM